MVLNLLCYSCFTIGWSGFQKCGMWMVSRVAMWASWGNQWESLRKRAQRFKPLERTFVADIRDFGFLYHWLLGDYCSDHIIDTMVIILSVLHPIVGMVWPCVHTVYMADSSKRRLSDVVPEACYGWCTKSKDPKFNQWLKTRFLLAQLLQNLIHQHQPYLVATPKSSRTLFVQWSWKTDRQDNLWMLP